MRTSRIRQLLLLLATLVAIALLGEAPASADVDCADLKSTSAAQSYFEGPPGDLDGLDADADGQACEANDPSSYGRLALPGLAVLLLGVLLVNGLGAMRRAGRGLEQPIPAEALPLQRLARQPTGGFLAAPGRKQALLDAAPDGSLDELARALRLVPADRRMSLVELYAVAHHAVPQDVLDALVAEVSDVGIQRWASMGYDRDQETFGAQPTT